MTADPFVDTDRAADGAPAGRLRLRDRSARRARGGALPLLRDALVWLLGVVGALAMLWLLASWVFGLQLVVLATGSMSPGLPAGSAVITRAVHAAELTVGDIVSVPRAYDGQLVTHRIVAIDSGPSDAERTLTLRGDANASEDAQPYVVSEARLTMIGVPGLGSAVAWTASPPGITTLAILLPLAVLWVLWPARR